MSAKSDGKYRRASLLNIVAATIAFISLQPVAVSARDLEDMLTTPFVDPLRTRPDVLERGVTLPGDQFPVQCPSGKDLSQPLAIIDAVDLALCNNPQVKAAWAAIKMQAAAVGTARAAYLPTISATASRLRTDTSYPGSEIPSSSDIGNTVYGSLSWRLFDFGTRAANRQSANSLLIAALADHEASLQTTLVSTIQAYFDVQSARAALQAKEQGLVIANDTLESAKRREAKGVVAHSDTLQATTALAKAILDRNRALGNYQKSLSILLYAMGLPAQSRIVLADEPENDDLGDHLGNSIAIQTENLDAWLHDAQTAHPAILSARAKWQAARSDISSARADGLPTIDFSANNYQNGYPGQGLQTLSSHINTIGVTLTIPLFDGFSHTYKVRSAQAQAEQRKEQLADIEHNVLMEVVKAYADAQSSLQNLQASLNLLEAAQEALASSQRKYDKGAADILEILNTQGALADAKQERVRCLAEWRSARLRLMANTGMLGMSSIQ